jgi:streptogramin lyase
MDDRRRSRSVARRGRWAAALVLAVIGSLTGYSVTRSAPASAQPAAQAVAQAVEAAPTGAAAAGTITRVATGVRDLEGGAPGPDGNLWFTEFGTDQVVRVTPTGTFTQFTTGPGRNTTEIVAGPDGALWFTRDKSIGRITTSGEASQSR